IGAMPGVEVTTQEYGHYLAFPVQPRVYGDDGERLDGNDAPQWHNAPPQALIDDARARATDRAPVVIDIPHPYDYFDDYRVDPVPLEPTSSQLVLLNPMLDPSLFTGDFEAMELANTKNYNRMRRATLGETRRYGLAFDALVARVKRGEIDQPTFDRLWLQLTT